MEKQIYSNRFTDDELQQQRRFWIPICRYLETYFSGRGAILDLGAGYCHFINTVHAGPKYALDVNEENLKKYAAPDVRIIANSGNDLGSFADASLDTVFASNVYEHFLTREDVLHSFSEVHRVLRDGGRFVVMQPNFAYCAREYFDFFDHRLEFTHRSIAEGLEVAGFDLVKVVDRFLPFTSKSKLPKAAWLVALYLQLPPAWKLLGAQMLVVAEKRSANGSRPSTTIFPADSKAR